MSKEPVVRGKGGRGYKRGQWKKSQRGKDRHKQLKIYRVNTKGPECEVFFNE